MELQVMKPRQGFSGTTVERVTDWLGKMEMTSKRLHNKAQYDQNQGLQVSLRK